MLILHDQCVMCDRLVLTSQPSWSACVSHLHYYWYLHDNLAHKIEIIHTNCRPHSNGQAG